VLSWREKQSTISETYGNNTRKRVTHRFQTLKKVYQPECTKRLIIGIIRTVTEAYQSHKLLPELRRHNGMVKHGFLSICIHLILPSVIISIKDLLKTQLMLNFYAQMSCINDWNNILLLNTNTPSHKFAFDR